MCKTGDYRPPRLMRGLRGISQGLRWRFLLGHCPRLSLPPERDAGSVNSSVCTDPLGRPCIRLGRAGHGAQDLRRSAKHSSLSRPAPLAPTLPEIFTYLFCACASVCVHVVVRIVRGGGGGFRPCCMWWLDGSL